MLSTFVAKLAVMVAAKFGSSPKASANSFNVFNVDGALLIIFVIALSAYCSALDCAISATLLAKAVVAICVLFTLDAAVGATGVPVNVGEVKDLFVKVCAPSNVTRTEVSAIPCTFVVSDS